MAQILCHILLLICDLDQRSFHDGVEGTNHMEYDLVARLLRRGTDRCS